MDGKGITVAELEAALPGRYRAPVDPEAPVAPEVATSGEPSGTGVTVAELAAVLGEMYIPPSLEEAA